MWQPASPPPTILLELVAKVSMCDPNSSNSG